MTFKINRLPSAISMCLDLPAHVSVDLIHVEEMNENWVRFTNIKSGIYNTVRCPDVVRSFLQTMLEAAARTEAHL